MNQLPQVWDVPLTDYLLFYFVFGIVGFGVCFAHRFFIASIVPLLLWFCIADIRSFFHQDLGSNKLGPDGIYIFIVAVSMIFAGALAVYGAYLNWRKNRFRFYDD